MTTISIRTAVAAGGLLASAGLAQAQSLDVRVPNLQRTDDPVSVAAGGTVVVNQGLQGVGRLPATTRDFLGDSLGSFSSLAVDLATWRRSGDTYTGTLYTLPDRGYNNPDGGLFSDYAGRLNRFTLSFTPYTGTALPQATTSQRQVTLTPDGGIVLLARDVTDMDRQEAEAAKAHRLDGIMRMTHQVSHEVGNMIGIITGSLGLLERETGFNDRQKRHLSRIRKAADRGRSLAGSMLSIGSQQPIHPGAVEIGALLRGMADVLEIAIGEKCRLVFDIAEGLPAVLLDPALFEQSVLNLCVNAAAAMPEGGTILVRSFRNETGVVVSVSDEGVGMSPEAADKAFEPYFTTRNEQGGAGLGLAVVYGFVRQSGGDARIHSTPGKGTTVELWFPARAGERPIITPPFP